jgi:YfiH family protein
MRALSQLPSLAPSFLWVSQPWGWMLQCSALLPLARHGWTTRSLRLTGPEEHCSDRWAQLADSATVAPGQLVRLAQIHGDEVLHVDEVSSEGGSYGRGDGLVTNRIDVVLTICVADCVPLLIADRQTGAVAAVHAGWRGTARCIAARAVARLQRAFGSNPENLVAGLGPSIGPCCYQVGPELEQTFTDAGWSAEARARCFVYDRDTRFDLWSANADQLRNAGVPADSIHIAGLCTACHPDLFDSYRRDGAGTGRLVGFIGRGGGGG